MSTNEQPHRSGNASGNSGGGDDSHGGKRGGSRKPRNNRSRGGGRGSNSANRANRDNSAHRSHRGSRGNRGGGAAGGRGRGRRNRSQRNNRSTHSRRNPSLSTVQRIQRAAQNSDLPLSVEESAGGLVLSGLAEALDGQGKVDYSRIYVALIGRLDRRGKLLWSMPKGHIEPNEAHSHTAEREVWEETGITGSVIADLGSIDYWFVSEGTRIHKTVHHFLLRYVDGDLNDEDPEVTEVMWLPIDRLIDHLAYADERRLVRQAFAALPELAKAEVAAGRATPR